MAKPGCATRGIEGVPQPFPYQGSKRQLARRIVACIPRGTQRLIEPFAGSAAVTVAAAYLRKARRFVINDVHAPLAELWKAILADPVDLTDRYERLWDQQEGREREFFDEVRAKFNRTHEPHLFLYLLARCVKGAVRYNGKGEFNNSPDNRRKGMRPATMRQNILAVSEILRGKARVTCCDYRECIGQARTTDVVYMDPPYQGVCDTRDHRYCRGVVFDEFVDALNDLNRRRVPYIVSYDGRTVG